MNKFQIALTAKSNRQSNIELLRIVAMFLVLVVHADFWSLGAPSIEEYQTALIPSLTRSGFEFLAIGCVNIFVAISGWFSIKTTVRGALSFIFQCVFLTSLVYFLLVVIGKESISFGGIKECLLLTDSLWFCKAYFALYIFAPVLNAYCDRANKRHFLALLIAFYIFQSTYGILDAVPFIMEGYSFFSFVGIYLSARFVRLYIACQDGSKCNKFIIGGGIALIISYLGYVIPKYFGIVLPELFLSYINPLIVYASLAMVLLFSRFNLGTNKWINLLSASVFAVYILHQSPFIANQYFKPFVCSIYDNNSGIQCIGALFLFLLVVFFVSIIIDQLRKYLWHRIAVHFNK